MSPAQPGLETGDDVLDRYFDELLNRSPRGDSARGPGEIAGEILSPSFVFVGPSRPAGVDRDGFLRFLDELWDGFPDKRFVELERITSGDTAVSRFRMLGTHDGSYLGIAATGRRTEVEGCDLFRLRDGRIAEVRAYFDLAALMRQLGVPGLPSA
ncbi:MAG: ester cyclase [Acidobacteriota bacterium]